MKARTEKQEARRYLMSIAQESQATQYALARQAENRAMDQGLDMEIVRIYKAWADDIAGSTRNSNGELVSEEEALANIRRASLTAPEADNG